MRPRLKIIASLVVGSLLSACGGGSESSTKPPPQQPVDAKPTVALGADQVLREKHQLTLNATVTDDKTGWQLQWQQLSGPALQLSSTTTASIVITAPEVTANAASVLRLTVTDSAGQTASDEISVQLVNNQLPQLTVTATPVIEKSVASLELTAVDPDGQIGHIHWQQVSGPAVELQHAESATVSFMAPAVTEPTPMVFRVKATDNDAESSSLDYQVTVEPMMLEYSLAGFVSLPQMAGAEVTAVVNDQTFVTIADANGEYRMTVRVDEDATNTMAVIRAKSVIQPALEFWGVEPHLASKDPTLVTNLTPYSTALLALAARYNQGVIPDSYDVLAAAQQKLPAALVAEGAVLAATYTKVNDIQLPPSQPTLFHTLRSPDAYDAFKAALYERHEELLYQVADELPLSPLNRLDHSEAQLMQRGLKLIEVAHPDYLPASAQFFRFAANNQLQFADETGAWSGQWSVLSGLDGSLRFEALSGLGQSKAVALADAGDLLPEEQLQRLEHAGITQLSVRLDGLFGALRRLAPGAGRELYQREMRVRLQIMPVQLPDETLEFEALVLETDDYAWGEPLLLAGLPVTEDQLAGQWLMPVPQDQQSWAGSSFQLEHLVLAANGDGFSQDSGLSFVWFVRLEINTFSPVLVLHFADGQNIEMKMQHENEAGYLTETVLYDADKNWRAAAELAIERF